MATIGNIQTIKEGHSVKEAVVSFFVQPSIVDPLKYKSLVLEGGRFYDVFQRFEPIKNISVSYNQTTEETSIKNVHVNGFKMVAFSDGEVLSLVQGINQFDKGVFTFHSLKYDSYNSFWKEVKQRASILASFDETTYLVKSFGLSYVDEFRALNPEEFQLSQIFNLESQFVPRMVSSSDLMDYNLSFHKQINDKRFAENLVIKIDKAQNTINIINNISFAILPMPFAKLLEDTSIDDFMQIAHDENKSLLISLLDHNVSKSIGL